MKYQIEVERLVKTLELKGKWRTLLISRALRKDRSLEIVWRKNIGHSFSQIAKDLNLTRMAVNRIYLKEMRNEKINFNQPLTK